MSSAPAGWGLRLPFSASESLALAASDSDSESHRDCQWCTLAAARQRASEQTQAPSRTRTCPGRRLT
jgi:hypothetical protein